MQAIQNFIRFLLGFPQSLFRLILPQSILIRFLKLLKWVLTLILRGLDFIPFLSHQKNPPSLKKMARE